MDDFAKEVITKMETCEKKRNDNLISMIWQLDFFMVSGYFLALYEKKLLTYPRTDSRYLTDDMAETATAVVHLSAKVPPFDSVPDYFPDVSLLVNNSKVTDHHAIIPTMELEKPEAISYVLNHYRNYIRKLATRTLKDEYGNEYLFVDEDMASRLQSKLVFSIISDFSILPA